MLKLGATTFWEDFDVRWLKNAAPIDRLPFPANPRPTEATASELGGKRRDQLAGLLRMGVDARREDIECWRGRAALIPRPWSA